MGKIRLGKICFVIIALYSFVGFSACFSAPKQTAETFADRNSALNMLNLANQAANRGNFKVALDFLEGAWRLAASADDSSLRIRVMTSRGNVYFFQSEYDKAFSEWEKASSEGDNPDSGKPELAALARIYSIRAKVLLLANENSGVSETAEELKGQLSKEMSIVRSDDFSTAAGRITMGLAERQLGRWNEAENEINQALGFYQRNDNLEDVAYCWFIIASIRSMAGNNDASRYEASIEALKTAISYDRRVENGYGLAASWRAMGDVYEKAGRQQDSQAAWRRAAEIYRAIGLTEQAEKLESQL